MEDEEIIFLIVTIGCSTSIIGSLFIISTYISLKELHGFSFRLVLYLAITEGIWSILAILSSNVTDELCVIIGFINAFWILAIVLQVGNFAVALYLAAVHDVQDVEKYEKWMLLVNFGFPAVITPLPLFTNNYGRATWCWVIIHSPEDYLGIFYRAICFYFWVWVIIVGSIIIYSKVAKIIYLHYS